MTCLNMNALNVVGKVLDPNWEKLHGRTNYTVHIRPDILSETDGPMLEPGIKEMDKTKLWVPAAAGEKPDPDRLDVRFKEFSGQI